MLCVWYNQSISFAWDANTAVEQIAYHEEGVLVIISGEIVMVGLSKLYLDT